MKPFSIIFNIQHKYPVCFTANIYAYVLTLCILRNIVNRFLKYKIEVLALLHIKMNIQNVFAYMKLNTDVGWFQYLDGKGAHAIHCIIKMVIPCIDRPDNIAERFHHIIGIVANLFKQ